MRWRMDTDAEEADNVGRVDYRSEWLSQGGVWNRHGRDSILDANASEFDEHT